MNHAPANLSEEDALEWIARFGTEPKNRRMNEPLPDPEPAECTDGCDPITVNGWRVCKWCDRNFGRLIPQDE